MEVKIGHILKKNKGNIQKTGRSEIVSSDL